MAGPVYGVGFRFIGEDALSPAARSASESMDAFSQSQTKAMEASKEMSMATVVTTGAMAAPFIGAVWKATTAAMGMEDVMYGLQRVTGMTEDQTAKLAKRFIEITAVLPMSALDLARVSTMIARLGVSGPKALEELAFTAAQFARATGMMAEEAGAALMRLTRMFKLDMVKSARAVSGMLTLLGNRTGATTREIIDITTRFGGMARQMEISIEDAAVLAATIKEMGGRTQATGTAMSKMVATMGMRTKAYAKFLGYDTVKAYKAAFGKSTLDILIRTAEGLSKVSKAEYATQLKKLGLSGVRTMQAISGLAANTEVLRERLKMARAEMARGNELTRSYGLMMKSLSARLGILRGSVQSTFIILGGPFLTVFKKVVWIGIKFFDLIAKLPTPVLHFAGVLTGLIAVVTGFVAWGAMTTFMLQRLAGAEFKAATGAVLLKGALTALWTRFKEGLVAGVALIRGFRRGAIFAYQYAAALIFQSSAQDAATKTDAAAYAWLHKRELKNYMVTASEWLRAKATVSAGQATLFAIAPTVGLTGAMKALGISIMGAIAPIIPIALAIGGVIGTLYLVYKAFADNWFGVTDALMEFAKPMIDAFRSIWYTLGVTLKSLWGIIAPVIKVIRQLFVAIGLLGERGEEGQHPMQILGYTIGALTIPITGLAKIIGWVLYPFMKLFEWLNKVSKQSKFWGGVIKTVLVGALVFLGFVLVGITKATWAWVASMIPAQKGLIRSIFLVHKQTWAFMANTIAKAKNVAVTWAGVWAMVKYLPLQAWQGILLAKSAVLYGLNALGIGAVNTGLTTQGTLFKTNTIWQSMSNILMAVGTAIGAAFAVVLHAIGDAFLFLFITSPFGWIALAIIGVVVAVIYFWDTIVGVFKWIWKMFKKFGPYLLLAFGPIGWVIFAFLKFKMVIGLVKKALDLLIAPFKWIVNAAKSVIGWLFGSSLFHIAESAKEETVPALESVVRAEARVAEPAIALAGARRAATPVLAMAGAAGPTVVEVRATVPLIVELDGRVIYERMVEIEKFEEMRRWESPAVARGI